MRVEKVEACGRGKVWDNYTVSWWTKDSAIKTKQLEVDKWMEDRIRPPQVDLTRFQKETMWRALGMKGMEGYEVFMLGAR